jgi:phosphatidylglycerol:prolipoprotein diacylglycerol transferase
MRPELFHIPFPWAKNGSIPIFSYGFMIMLGFIFAILYGAWRARKEGEDPNHVLDIGIYAVVSGILGSRLFYYIEFYQKHFADRPWYVLFFIWEGGIVFYGGLIAGAATVLTYLKVKRLPVWKFADILACTIPVGLSFGRIGCFLNGCCWGQVDRTGHALLALPFPKYSPAWSYHVEHGWIQPSASESLPVHCTQLYEWGGAWLIAAALFLFYRWHRREGQVFAMLFILYGPVRYVIEGLRDHDPAERMIGSSALWDPIAGNFMTKSQVVSLAVLLFGLVIIAIFSLVGNRYQTRTSENP